MCEGQVRQGGRLWWTSGGGIRVEGINTQLFFPPHAGLRWRARVVDIVKVAQVATRAPSSPLYVEGQGKTLSWTWREEVGEDATRVRGGHIIACRGMDSG